MSRELSRDIHALLKRADEPLRRMWTVEDNTPASDFPYYWFALFDRAIEDGDLAKAVKAQRELKRLGYEVKYRPARRPRERQVAHA